MTADLEFKGRNVDKAVERAAKTLQVPVEDLHYEVLSHGSSGIFGLAGVKKARIRVLNAQYEPVVEEAEPERAAVAEDDAHGTDAAPVSMGPSDAQAVGEAVLRRMVDAISPEAMIAVARDDQQLRFEVKGGQPALLIGKRGQTLEALQTIVEKAVRRVDGHELRLEVDVEGYLAKKRAGLEHSAERMAQKVAAKGCPTSVGYLNAHDRRVVHLALKENAAVRTKSIGEGPLRKLMIYPRQKPKVRS